MTALAVVVHDVEGQGASGIEVEEPQAPETGRTHAVLSVLVVDSEFGVEDGELCVRVGAWAQLPPALTFHEIRASVPVEQRFIAELIEGRSLTTELNLR